MLIVTNAKQSEFLFESNYQKTEEQNGEALEISFSSFYFPENIGHSILDYETLIEDEDGHEYKVKQFKQVGNEKQVTALHIFFELGEQMKNDMFGGTHTFDEFASFLFNGTGWTYKNDGLSGSEVIENFGNNNILKLITDLRDNYKCEIEILPGKVVRFAPIVGEKTDFQYRYKHNINTLTQSIDTTSLKTQITGIGGNGVNVTYTSPLANNPLIGIRVADTYEDSNIVDKDEMIKVLKEKIKDIPDTTIEISVNEIDGNVGDFVFIIHDEMNLDYETRILSKKTTRNKYEGTVTVGNVLPKTIVDALVTQKATIVENNKVMRSKFEQTNERINMEVETINESIANITIKGSEEIEAKVMNKVDEKLAAVTIRTDEIELKVEDVNTTIDDLGTRVSSNESLISQHSSQISMKVSQTDFNGNTIASLINQTADTVTIDASKINLRGAVTVLSDLSNDLGSITAGNIDLQTDIKVGSRVWLNGGYEGGIYFDRLGSSGKLYSTGTNLVLANDNVQISTMYGATVYGGLRVEGGLTVDGMPVTGGGGYSAPSGDYPTTRTSGLSFGFSTAADRLYVGLNGYDYGYIPLTPL